MVVMDSTLLLLLFQPNALPPIDSVTGQPLDRCKERINLLLEQLNQTHTRIMIPTPALSEILVGLGVGKSAILSHIKHTHIFKIQPFDETAAVEVAFLTDQDLQSGRKLTADETKAKVKYDRQIIAIAKVNGVKTIYSDDVNLGKRAVANKIDVITTASLPLPPEPPQAQLPLSSLAPTV